MIKFIFKSFLFVALVIGMFFLILSKADGYTDSFYLKFTTPKQENLILGSSRAAQALQPEIFKEVCGVNFYNYSFTSYDSPFGDVYLSSIKNKIKKGNTKGVFVITVDPWSIVSELENPNNYKKFRELNSCLANTKEVDANPNFKYLLNNLKGRYYSILTQRDTAIFLHNDGWLEVSVPMDEKSILERTNNKIDYYEKNLLPKSNFSSLRLDYLKQTILYLNKYGKVYLVRLPIHPKFMNLENKLMPKFNSYMEELTTLTQGYLDMTPENSKFKYVDGNHLYKEDGKIVSKKIANWIKETP